MNTHTHQKTPRATRTSNHECGTVTTIYKIYKTCWSCLHSKLLRSAATQAAAECPSPLLLRVSDPLREARKLLLLLDEAQLMGHWVIETGFASPRVCDAQDSFQPYDKHSGSSQFTSLNSLEDSTCSSKEAKKNWASWQPVRVQAILQVCDIMCDLRCSQAQLGGETCATDFWVRGTCATVSNPKTCVTV